MAKNTSILLGEYFENFIAQQIQSGKFSSASEVIRTALRIFEHEESKKTILINELKKGEKSGFSKDFNRNSFRNELHKKYAEKQ
jgi:antitoxin ParD1/3/4